jgi:hypothetical protein
MTRAFLEFSRDEMRVRGLVRGEAARGEAIGRIELQRIRDQIDKLSQLKILGAVLTAESVATTEFLPQAQH